MVVVGRGPYILISDKLPVHPIPNNFTSAQVSDTRIGVERGQVGGLFQISRTTARMEEGR